MEVLAEDDQSQSSPVLTRVRVSVRDVNDHAPLIELMPSERYNDDVTVTSDVTWWQLNVSEHAGNGTFVGHVMVSDADHAGSQRVNCLLRRADNQPTVRLWRHDLETIRLFPDSFYVLVSKDSKG